MTSINLDLFDFANSFGVSSTSIDDNTKTLICELNFKLNLIEDKDKDKLIMLIIDKIRSDSQVVAAPERNMQWEFGWSENLQNYLLNKKNPISLVPRYIRGGQPIRWKQEFYNTSDPNFELNFIHVLRSFIYNHYIKNIAESVYEFGAGTGHNLIHFANMNPELKLIGLDFTKSSVELLNKLAIDFSINLKGVFFDMLRPDDYSIDIPENAVALTFGAVEQLGVNFMNFLNYLLFQKPRIVIHIEPIIEFYDRTILPDYLAEWFQRKRGYTSNFLEAIKDAQKNKKVRIVHMKRLFFGSLMMEGYNLIVWEPI